VLEQVVRLGLQLGIILGLSLVPRPIFANVMAGEKHVFFTRRYISEKSAWGQG